MSFDYAHERLKGRISSLTPSTALQHKVCRLCPHPWIIFENLEQNLDKQKKRFSLDSDKAELQAFVKDKGMEWPQYFDGKGWQNEISTKYGINSIPAMWLLNKKGMVVSTNARGGLEETVAKLLAE